MGLVSLKTLLYGLYVYSEQGNAFGGIGLLLLSLLTFSLPYYLLFVR